jgi:hypothetical protein
VPPEEVVIMAARPEKVDVVIVGAGTAVCYQQTVGPSGVVGWTCHRESKGAGGTATVSCSFRGQTRSITTSLSIA